MVPAAKNLAEAPQVVPARRRIAREADKRQ
jgi:hypothetical protein